MKNNALTDRIPGSHITPGFTPGREFTADVNVWEDGGKLFMRIPIDGGHPLQVEVDISDKTFDVYGYD